MFKYRFIHRIKSDDYLIQRKNWLGQWKYCRYTVRFTREGLPIDEIFVGEDKELLLDRILKSYNVGRDTSLLEYPTLIMK